MQRVWSDKMFRIGSYIVHFYHLKVRCCAILLPNPVKKVPQPTVAVHSFRIDTPQSRSESGLDLPMPFQDNPVRVQVIALDCHPSL